MSTRGRMAAVAAAALVVGFGGPASAQTATSRGVFPARFANLPQVIVPGSSIKRSRDAGLRAHANVRILNLKAAPNYGPPYYGTFYETPASLACIYGLVAVSSGCNPNTVTKNASGGSKVVAIVDAFDYPTALADLRTYSTQFGLPAPNLQVVYASGTRPAQDETGGWELEEALDISMVHALAPNAKIILVEAASNSNSDLYLAERKAGALVAAAGGGEVSNSWGEGEYSGETSEDGNFVTNKVVYFASTGDSAGTEYPSVSPNVVAVGGTTIGRNPVTGAFEYEISWDQDGGGPSAYEARPSYQSGIATTVGSHRGVPDIAAVANPSTGVWIYDSTPYQGSTGWWTLGGTSVASPVVAAVINAAGAFNPSSAVELASIYTSKARRDIHSGACGPNEGYPSLTGWDFCTGVGVPIAGGN